MHLVVTAIDSEGRRRVHETHDLRSGDWPDIRMQALLPLDPKHENAVLLSVHKVLPDQYQMEHGRFADSTAFRKFCASKGWNEGRDGSSWAWAHKNLTRRKFPGHPDFEGGEWKTTGEFRPGPGWDALMQELSLPPDLVFIPAGGGAPVTLGKVTSAGSAACQRELDARAACIKELEARVQQLDSAYKRLSQSADGWWGQKAIDERDAKDKRIEALEDALANEKAESANLRAGVALREERLKYLEKQYAEVHANGGPWDSLHKANKKVKELEAGLETALRGMTAAEGRAREFRLENEHLKGLLDSKTSFASAQAGLREFGQLSAYYMSLLERVNQPIMMQFPDDQSAKTYMRTLVAEAQARAAETKLKAWEAADDKIHRELAMAVGLDPDDDLCTWDLIVETANGFKGLSDSAVRLLGVHGFAVFGRVRPHMVSLALSDLADRGGSTDRRVKDLEEYIAEAKGALLGSVKAVPASNHLATEIAALVQCTATRWSEADRRKVLEYVGVIDPTVNVVKAVDEYVHNVVKGMSDIWCAMGQTWNSEKAPTWALMREVARATSRGGCPEDVRLRLSSALGLHPDVHISTLASTATIRLTGRVSVDKDLWASLMRAVDIADPCPAPNPAKLEDWCRRTEKSLKASRANYIDLERSFVTERKQLEDAKAKVRALSKFFANVPGGLLEDLVDDLTKHHLERINTEEFAGTRTWVIRFSRA